MPNIDLKAFLKEFKSYENKVGKGRAWSELLSEVGNAAKNATTRSFEAQQSPFNEAWQALSPRTLARKKGSLKLVESGHLKRSIQSTSNLSEKSVSIGSNLAYAPIHQFGGLAGRKHGAKIPARPFLPINANDELAPDVEKRIKRAVNEYFTL